MPAAAQRLILHLDVNKTLILTDPASMQDTAAIICGILAANTFGTVSAGADGVPTWTPSGDRLGRRLSGDSISYDAFLWDHLNPYIVPAAGASPAELAAVRAHNGAQRSKSRKLVRCFLDPGQPGERYKPVADALVERLRLPTGDGALANPAAPPSALHADGFHFLVPAYFRLLSWLASQPLPFLVTIRTFGDDLPLVALEHNQYCSGSHRYYAPPVGVDLSPLVMRFPDDTGCIRRHSLEPRDTVLSIVRHHAVPQSQLQLHAPETPHDVTPSTERDAVVGALQGADIHTGSPAVAARGVGSAAPSPAAGTTAPAAVPAAAPAAHGGSGPTVPIVSVVSGYRPILDVLLAAVPRAAAAAPPGAVALALASTSVPSPSASSSSAAAAVGGAAAAASGPRARPRAACGRAMALQDDWSFWFSSGEQGTHGKLMPVDMVRGCRLCVRVRRWRRVRNACMLRVVPPTHVPRPLPVLRVRRRPGALQDDPTTLQVFIDDNMGGGRDGFRILRDDHVPTGVTSLVDITTCPADTVPVPAAAAASSAVEAAASYRILDDAGDPWHVPKADANIVDMRNAATGASVPFHAVKNVHLCRVDPLSLILNPDYYVQMVQHCIARHAQRLTAAAGAASA